MTTPLAQMIRDKKEWRTHMARVKKMPRDYQIVYKEIEKYLFNFSAAPGMATIAGLYQLIDFLEEGVKNKVPVLDYVGRDVGQFAEDYSKSLGAKTE